MTCPARSATGRPPAPLQRAWAGRMATCSEDACPMALTPSYSITNGRGVDHGSHRRRSNHQVNRAATLAPPIARHRATQAAYGRLFCCRSAGTAAWQAPSAQQHGLTCIPACHPTSNPDRSLARSCGAANPPPYRADWRRRECEPGILVTRNSELSFRIIAYPTH